MVPEADSAVFKTDPATGIYKARLMPGDYSLVVESPGYLKQTAWVLVERDKPLVRDFQLVTLRMVVTLHGIYFDFDRATIKPESRSAIEDAAEILIQNPTIKVEIQGHTDSVGSDKYNQRLSEKRAQAVVDYLVKETGIDSRRLTAKGYGESRPVADNKTESGRALNRRVEFLILGQTGQ
jgi:outer membrane protein OmpA-like peptidoglycan-associated protein